MSADTAGMLGLRRQMDANRKAPAFAQHEIYIEARPEHVWTLVSDIARWSVWQPDIATAALRGPLAPASTVTWRSGGTPVTSTIQEVDPPRRLAWTGRAAGAKAKHVWTIEPQGTGVLVRTEESFDGLVVVLLRGLMQRRLDSSLLTWLAALKKTAEASSPPTTTAKLV